MYCNQCGGKVDSKDKFCPNCGRPVMPPSAGGHPQASANQPPQPPKGAYANQASQPTAQTAGSPKRNAARSSGVSAPNETTGNVRYVYVDPQTGKIASPPHGKSRSESFMQWMTIAFIAIGLVIVMVAGSMFISEYMVKSVFSDNVVSGPIEDFVTSWEGQQSVSSQEELTVSSDEDDEADEEEIPSSDIAVSSEAVVVSSQESTVPEKLRAEYIQSHLKGKWTTDIPYKSMSLPATFVFDGKGKCSCEMKALFITKKFDGTYTVKDGGQCAITLNGLEDYVADGNTMEGQIEIVKEDKINFTVGDIVWELNKA